MQKEIGSNFWLSPNDVAHKSEKTSSITPKIFGVEGSDWSWMSTGRSATALVIKTIEERNPTINKTVFLPSFTCHTVFEPFLEAGYKIITYSIDKSLSTDGKKLLEITLENKAGIVLVHRYFGFDTIYGLDEAVEQLRDNGIMTIEDCTQSLYSSFPDAKTDFHVASIRKWCGVPDGGFAICSEGQLSEKPTSPDLKLGYAKVEASLMKYRWLENNEGEKNDFLSAYRSAEDILDRQDRSYTIHPISLSVQQDLNVKQLKDKRRQNFTTLLNRLKGIETVKPIFNSLPENVVPLYFPVYCEDRKEVQGLLARNSVFAPVVWPKTDNCPDICPDADDIYNHILSIPIDQRYDTDDMERIISIIKSN